MNFDNLKLNNQICHRLYIASNGITRLYRPLLEELDLTYPQYILMMALWEVESISVQGLQKVTKIDSGSLTLILKKVVAKKYINLKPDAKDKRAKIVSLTKRGLELKKKAHEIPGNMFCKINSLSQEDLSDLVRILDKVNNQIVQV